MPPSSLAPNLLHSAVPFLANGQWPISLESSSTVSLPRSAWLSCQQTRPAPPWRDSGPSLMTSPLHCPHRGPASITALQSYPSSLLTSVLTLRLPPQSVLPSAACGPVDPHLSTTSHSLHLSQRKAQVPTVFPKVRPVLTLPPCIFPIRSGSILPQGLCTVISPPWNTHPEILRVFI